MTEDSFVELFDPLLPEFDCFYFVPPDWELGLHTFVKAYVNFVNIEDSQKFQNKFHGISFVDTKGIAYPTTVEFVPSQTLPQNKIIKSEMLSPLCDIDIDFMNLLTRLKIEEVSGSGSYNYKLFLKKI